MPIPLLAALGGALKNPTVQSGIAAGIGSIFKKKAKSPEFQMPNIPGLGDLPHYLNLKDAAEKRISGEVGGFGPEFVDKATNPAIVDRERRFREDTIPTISNEASKRGMARSSLTTDRIAKEERNTQNDIDQLLSNFYVLNEQQKKRDFSEGVGIAERQRGVSQDLALARAGAEQGQNSFNLQRYPIEAAQKGADNLFTLETIQDLLGVKSPQDKLAEVFSRSFENNSSPRSNILGSLSDDDINRMIMERQFARRLG